MELISLSQLRGHLLRRDDSTSAASSSSSSSSISPTIIDLLITLLVLFILTIVLMGALYFIRRMRRRRAIERQTLLPTHHRPLVSNHRRSLTITTSPYGRGSTLYVYDEKDVEDNASPPRSPEAVPEIRITFPDEQDEITGARKEGRVVVVRVGDRSVGLEPVKGTKEEQLPKYEKGNGFEAIDMDSIGGLKEKKEWS